MKLVNRSGGGAVLARQPLAKPPSLLELVREVAAVESWPWGTEGDWRPRAEEHLRELEGRHRAAQGQTFALRERLAVLGTRIEKGRHAIAQPEALPSWRHTLDALEIEYAEASVELTLACGRRDALADDYCRKLAGYERLVDAEDGHPAKRRPS